jgi:bacterioferritin-associated ferredoxin
MVICRCEEVTLHTIKKTMNDGAQTSKEIKLRSRAGMGICQGRTCRPLIDQLISSTTRNSRPTIEGLAYQIPVRPTLIKDFFSSKST